jgi:hypothetical protein
MNKETHSHHTHFVHFGTHKAAIVTAEHEDGSVDLVYFNGGPDATPHAATKVKHSHLGEDGTFHHHHEHMESLVSASDEALSNAEKKQEAALQELIAVEKGDSLNG